MKYLCLALALFLLAGRAVAQVGFQSGPCPNGQCPIRQVSVVSTTQAKPLPKANGPVTASPPKIKSESVKVLFVEVRRTPIRNLAHAAMTRTPVRSVVSGFLSRFR